MARSANNSKGPNSGIPIPEISEAQTRRFFQKIDRADTDACWLWTGYKDESGYGRVCINYRHFRAHRIAYCLEFGNVDSGLVVAHKCNNPACCNPRHLEATTQSANVVYSVGLGRTKLQPRKGEQCQQTPLTAAMVQQIRAMYDAGNISQTKLGEQFGINQTCVGAIIRRKTWKHVP